MNGGFNLVRIAGLVHLTYRQYLALKAGELGSTTS
jgi:hypothetical protein